MGQAVKGSAAATATTTSVDLSSFYLSPSSSSFYLWHFHLGHVSFSHLRFLASTEALENFQTCDIFYCSGCKLIKKISLPFNQSIFVSFSLFDLIHFNVWEPSSIATKEGLNIIFLLLMITMVIIGFI